jgi:hypothetical protein
MLWVTYVPGLIAELSSNICLGLLAVVFSDKLYFNKELTA